MKKIITGALKRHGGKKNEEEEVYFRNRLDSHQKQKGETSKEE